MNTFQGRASLCNSIDPLYIYWGKKESWRKIILIATILFISKENLIICSGSFAITDQHDKSVVYTI